MQHAGGKIVLARVLVTTCMVIALSQAVVAADETPTLKLGFETWVVLAGALVTIGINVEQLRRVRADVKEIKATQHHQERQAQSLDDRLNGIELTLSFLNPHPRAFREKNHDS